MVKTEIRLKDEYVDEIKSKYNTTSLGRALNFDTAVKILHGNANITLRNYIKLCKLMDWPIPECIQLQNKDNDK